MFGVGYIWWLVYLPPQARQLNFAPPKHLGFFDISASPQVSLQLTPYFFNFLGTMCLWQDFERFTLFPAPPGPCLPTRPFRELADSLNRGGGMPSIKYRTSPPRHLPSSARMAPPATLAVPTPAEPGMLLRPLGWQEQVFSAVALTVLPPPLPVKVSLPVPPPSQTPYCGPFGAIIWPVGGGGGVASIWDVTWKSMQTCSGVLTASFSF